MWLIFTQPVAGNNRRLHCKIMVIFFTRTDSFQSMILSYKMNQFHFCTWSSISHFVTYASLTAFFSVFQQPCANKGHCVLNNANSYTCICRPGWSGQHCRINVNDCVQHWCQNGATCVDEIDGYRWVLKSQLSTEKKKKSRMWMIAKAVTYTAFFRVEGIPLTLYSIKKFSLICC